MAKKLTGPSHDRFSSHSLNLSSQHLSPQFRSRLRAAVLFVVAGVLASGSAWAQAVYGSIAGTVYDGSGSPIPNASVTVTNVERNTTSSVTTNESGNYAQTHLIIGHYTVRVEAPGFNVEVQEGVELAIDTVSTVDFHLKPGKFRRRCR
jgi:Carboxypeptidase regulatory-like domain